MRLWENFHPHAQRIGKRQNFIKFLGKRNTKDLTMIAKIGQGYTRLYQLWSTNDLDHLYYVSENQNKTNELLHVDTTKLAYNHDNIVVNETQVNALLPVSRQVCSCTLIIKYIALDYFHCPQTIFYSSLNATVILDILQTFIPSNYRNMFKQFRLDNPYEHELNLLNYFCILMKQTTRFKSQFGLGM